MPLFKDSPATIYYLFVLSVLKKNVYLALILIRRIVIQPLAINHLSFASSVTY